MPDISIVAPTPDSDRNMLVGGQGGLSQMGGNLPPDLVPTIIRKETGNNPYQISSAGAAGLMQIMPKTAQEQALKLGLPYDRDRLLNDVNYNKTLGTSYLSELYDKYSGNRTLTMAAYNAGPGVVDRWIRQYGDPRRGQISDSEFASKIPYSETRNYVGGGSSAGAGGFSAEGFPLTSALQAGGNDRLLALLGAIPGGVAQSYRRLLGVGGEERYQTWPERMAIQALNAPQDTMNGAYGPPGSREFSINAIPGALAMAGVMGTGGFGRAALTRPLSEPRDFELGVFGGRQAKTFDETAARTSDIAAKAGMHPDDVWQGTGYSRNFPDKGQRFEIDDSKSQVTNMGNNMLTHVPYSLKEVLDHPDLYQAYPNLKNATVVNKPDLKAAASWDPATGGIELNPKLGDVKGSLLHEIQHSVDNKEGFGIGDSPNNHLPAGFDKRFEGVKRKAAGMDRYVDNLDETIKIAQNRGFNLDEAKFRQILPHLADLVNEPKPSPDSSHLAAFIHELYEHPQVGKYIKDLGELRSMISQRQEAVGKYEKTTGEVSARSVQERMDKTAAQRRDLPPWYSEDVPRSKQVYRGSDYYNQLSPPKSAASEPPSSIENLLTEHARGNMTPKDIRKQLPEGWSVDFRRGRYDYEVVGPDGKVHYISP